MIEPFTIVMYILRLEVMYISYNWMSCISCDWKSCISLIIGSQVQHSMHAPRSDTICQLSLWLDSGALPGSPLYIDEALSRHQWFSPQRPTLNQAASLGSQA